MRNRTSSLGESLNAPAFSAQGMARASRVPLAERSLRRILLAAEIEPNGNRSWDPQIHDDRFYPRVLSQGSMGLGEAYMEGWWDCDAIDEMIFRVVRARIEERISMNLPMAAARVASILLNLQNQSRSGKVGETHYDLGNDFFEAMLDPQMQYSCAYFQDTTSLAEAQNNKLQLICRKLGLKPGMRLLDIGCGWGGLAKHAAQHHGCKVTGITISREQQSYAMQLCRGLPVEILLQDYRDLSPSYDRIVSVGMMEHVGYKNYRRYLETAGRCLRDGGLFLCHTIGGQDSRTFTDRWIERYIFPNSMIPSVSQVSKASEGVFVIEDIQNFGAYYDATLLAWEKNFCRSWHRFATRYGERFRRMWRFYLLSCAGAFRARSLQVFQFLFSKGGMEGGFHRET